MSQKALTARNVTLSDWPFMAGSTAAANDTTPTSANPAAVSLFFWTAMGWSPNHSLVPVEYRQDFSPPSRPPAKYTPDSLQSAGHQSRRCCGSTPCGQRRCEGQKSGVSSNFARRHPARRPRPGVMEENPTYPGLGGPHWARGNPELCSARVRDDRVYSRLDARLHLPRLVGFAFCDTDAQIDQAENWL